MCSLAQGRHFDLKIRPTSLLREEDLVSEHIGRLRGITELFETIDQDLLDCVNGTCCGPPDCQLDSMRILLKMAGIEAVVPTDIHHEAERADILITKRWLQSKLWLVCITHQLLLFPSIVPELSMEYPLELLRHTHAALRDSTMSALETNSKAMVSFP